MPQTYDVLTLSPDLKQWWLVEFGVPREIAEKAARAWGTRGRRIGDLWFIDDELITLITPSEQNIVNYHRVHIADKIMQSFQGAKA